MPKNGKQINGVLLRSRIPLLYRQTAPAPGRFEKVFVYCRLETLHLYPGRFDKPLRISTVLIEPYVMKLNYSISDDPFKPRYEGKWEFIFRKSFTN